MGSGLSRTGSGHSRRPMIRRTISSFLACSTASLSREMEDYPNELLAKSAEHVHQKKLKSPRRNANLSLGNGKDLISVNTESMVSSGRNLNANENHIPSAGASNVGHENRGKCLSENWQSVPPPQSIDNASSNNTASTSYLNHPSPFHFSTNDMPCMDSTIGVNGKMNGDLLDEVSVENNVSDEVDFSNYELSSSSFVSSSSFNHHLLREDSLQDVTPSGFVVSEMEQSQQDGSLLQVEVLSLSSNVLPTDSAEVSTQVARRNGRRLFWDAFSRRNSRNHSELRMSALYPGDSDPWVSHDRLDFSGGFHDDEIGSSNEQSWNSRPEIWERLRGTLDSTHHRTSVCPRGIHGNVACSCSGSSAEEPGSRAGISRIVMLAEALFEVLDQIHQHPVPLSLSVVSLPAPESIVDSFPLKAHTTAERLESAEDDVLQCYICLAEYEEGDKIRILPCHHEFHMTCVDKWLKEIHGVCPLCRGDVGKIST